MSLPSLVPSSSLRRNALLSLIEGRTLASLESHLERVDLVVPRSLESEGRPLAYAYFPISGVASVLASVEGAERRIEVGTIGNEGMVGLSLFLGAKRAAGETFVQVAGEAYRLPAAALLQATREHRELVDVLHRYTRAYMVQVSQAAACNRAHSPEQRCARWLLMTQDRMHTDTFELKQEFLAMMLGERRMTVSNAESNLKDRGIIAYRRGNVTVLDRSRLHAAACPCYDVIRKEYDAMLGSELPRAATGS